MGKFKTNVFYSLLFETTGQFCGGFGWEAEAITLKLSTDFDLQDCYKTMISDLCDWSSTFSAKESKWIDECTPSQSSGSVTIKKWEITQSLTDQALIGGLTPGGRGCWQLADWTKWTPYLLQTGLNLFQQVNPDVDSGMSYDDFTATQ